MLKIRDLSLHKKRQILQEISLDIPKGRMTLLIGKSGSGKTSLLRSIGQIEKGYEGEIKYEGVSLAEMSIKDRSALIGFVSQSFALFPHLNVWENCLQPLNVHFGKKKGLYEEVEKILTSLGMKKHLKSRVHELSGGQQQRVAIARALLLNPSFLLLDEPTSALDPENTEILRKMIQTLLKEEKGIVISTQDMTFAESILDRAFFLEEGALVESYDRYNGMKGPKLERFFS